MKKTMLATSFVAFPLLAKSTQVKTYGFIAIVLLAGCTATQVRWDATKIREQVMVYYNDQIMDNLIKAKNHLPFVHVDITLLTSQGGSQISGTIGGGETRTHTDSSMIGAASSFMKAVMRPFTYSVTPQQTESLSITAAPALGSQALAAPSTYPPVLTATKETTTLNADKTPKNTTIERTLEARPRKNIYDLYEKFAASHLSDDPIQPNKGAYVPGTLKRWGTEYYYIKQAEGRNYYEFCKELFLKGQAGSLEKALQEVQSSATLQR